MRDQIEYRREWRKKKIADDPDYFKRLAQERYKKPGTRDRLKKSHDKWYERKGKDRYWTPGIRERIIEQNKRGRDKLRTEVLEKYGGSPPKCACCGESMNEFLAIDHIDGGGNIQRKKLNRPGGIMFYRWLRKNGYPSGFRVLCHNCNMSRGFYGYCPHTKLADSVEIGPMA